MLQNNYLNISIGTGGHLHNIGIVIAQLPSLINELAGVPPEDIKSTLLSESCIDMTKVIRFQKLLELINKYDIWNLNFLNHNQVSIYIYIYIYIYNPILIYIMLIYLYSIC